MYLLYLSTVHVHVYLSVCLSVRLTVHQSIHPSIYLSIYNLSMYMYMCTCIYWQTFNILITLAIQCRVCTQHSDTCWQHGLSWFIFPVPHKIWTRLVNNNVHIWRRWARFDKITDRYCTKEDRDFILHVFY